VRIAVDVGGTFTDVVLLGDDGQGLRHEKVETVPADPASGVISGFAKAGAELSSLDFFVHGTTLGINALLTRTGARVAIVTTRGFRDVYEVGRTDRDPMYDFKYRRPPSLVPRHLVFEVAERRAHDGSVLIPFDRESAVAAARRIRELGVNAVAVCFLHSYADPAHELAMEEVLQEECPDVSVTLSHRLSREYREYERTPGSRAARRRAAGRGAWSSSRARSAGPAHGTGRSACRSARACAAARRPARTAG